VRKLQHIHLVLNTCMQLLCCRDAWSLCWKCTHGRVSM